MTWGIGEEHFEQYKVEGYLWAAQGGKESDNPYEPSGHERDTTFDDERHYQWYVGFNSYTEKESNGL